MFKWIYLQIKEYFDCMKDAHLLDEAYMELNMDEELGKGDW